ncbi:MAG: PhoH family protein [Bacteroidota bacterium]
MQNKTSKPETSTFTIDHVEPVLILGFHDQHLKTLEDAFPELGIHSRGALIKATGPKNRREQLMTTLEEMVSFVEKRGSLESSDLEMILLLTQPDQPRTKNRTVASVDRRGEDPTVILHTHAGETVAAKTAGQRRIVDATEENDIVFAIGPAGTGKTYTSVALAVQALKQRRVKKIVLARPAVEAGENLGFLPGDLKEKIDPYLRPLYDALEEMIEQDKLDYYLSKNIIEIAPLAYMRGRTLNNAYVILDEAQNATNTQMKMFLTRIGFHSRAIITGDITQTDLPKKQHSGLISIQEILNQIPGISFVYLDQQDVVRHALVRQIIEAYERFEEGQDKRK